MNETPKLWRPGFQTGATNQLMLPLMLGGVGTLTHSTVSHPKLALLHPFTNQCRRLSTVMVL